MNAAAILADINARRAAGVTATLSTAAITWC